MAGITLVINADGPQRRVAVVENSNLIELYIESQEERGIVGHVYKGRVVRVLPGMQAAFVDIGLDRTAFLYVADIWSPDMTPYLDDSDYCGDEPSQDGGSVAKPSIEDLVSEGQEIVVQVAKEPLGTKGARVTTHITLPGRHVVFMPTVTHVGVSRRITDEHERRRLKDVVEALRRDENTGYIIRTVAEEQSSAKLASDMNFLTRLWEQIQHRSQKTPAPARLHADLDLVLRSIRDLLGTDPDRCVVDSLAEYDRIKDFVSTFMPRFTNNIDVYEGHEPIFDVYGLETQLNRALERRVWLKSGGYLVIEQTEALTAIDVNTGRFVGRRNLEETITQTNLEACHEIAIQVRLRNIGGIIVIDFIDMTKEANRQKVWTTLEDALAKDRVRCHIGKISNLGLVEMTRKRTRESLIHSLTEPCPYCEGRGFLKSADTICNEILRGVRKESTYASGNTIVVECHPDVAEILTQTYHQEADDLEKRLAREIIVRPDPRRHREEFEIHVTQHPGGPLPRQGNAMP